MAGVYKQTIKSLQPNTQNSLVIGVVMNTMNTKTFQGSNNSNTKYNTSMRGVWTFTLRDSVEDLINVTVWGSQQFVVHLNSRVHIGDVIEVICAKVVSRRFDDRNEEFVPSVRTPYSLVLNEGSSLIQRHEDETSVEQLKALLRVPTKELDNLQTLKDILQDIEAKQDTYVDVLLIVTFVSEAKNVTTRSGAQLLCRKFEVKDTSCDEIVSLMLWEKEMVERAQFWEPKKTVLLLENARIVFDAFQKKVVLSIARKTLIIENPDMPQSDSLRSHLREQPDFNSTDPFSLPKSDTIKTVMTIQQISEMLTNSKTSEIDNRLVLVTIVYATIADWNLDSIHSDLLIVKCSLCKRTVLEDRDSCMDLDCPSGNGTREPLNSLILNIKVNLKDETGYLIGCRLTGKAAEEVLNCTPEEFQTMNLLERRELKLKYLMEKCDIRLQVIGGTANFPRNLYNILSIKRLRDVDNDQGFASDFKEIGDCN